MAVVHPYTEKTEGGRLLQTWYTLCMEEDKKITVFVMQSGINPKDVFIAQTSKNPVDVVSRYNSVENPKTLAKPLGQMLPLTLRPDLAGENNVFSSEVDAIEYRKELSEEIEKMTYTYTLRSKRSFFFGKKKSVKNKQTGKYTLVLDPSLMKQNDSRGIASESSTKDAFAYGRKKSAEWNDEVASTFEESLKKNAADRLKNQ
mgnify:CR=1 FL=1